MPHTDPFEHFAAWFAQAAKSEPNDANAMTVACCTPDARPSARIVLLKDHDLRGFVFYTNKQSRKGQEISANRHAALLFHWKSLGRQVRIEGVVEDVSNAEADAYFAIRPRDSRLGAWASLQSQALPDRATLLYRVADADTRYPGDEIPRPPHWSGYRVVPQLFEFWQDMPFRLHERITYVRDGNSWATGHLYP